MPLIDVQLQLALLFSSVAFFEIIFQFAGLILRLLVKRQGFVVRNECTSLTNIVVNLGPSYACSTIHSFIVFLRGVEHLVTLFHASPTDQLYNAPTGVIQTNLFFLGYLIYDLQHVVRSFPKLGGADVLIHHTVFMTCSIISGVYEILPFTFAWLIIGELSTIFLNARWFLIKTGRGDTDALKMVEKLFALSFFATRVVIYLFGVFDLFWKRETLLQLVKHGRVPAGCLAINLFFIFAGGLLNISWFRKIATIALSAKKPHSKVLNEKPSISADKAKSQ